VRGQEDSKVIILDCYLLENGDLMVIPE